MKITGRDRLFSTRSEFSEKLSFQTPDTHRHVRVRIKGLEILDFSENLVYVLH